jgi:hypothetical protein
MTLGRLELIVGIAKYGWQMYRWLRAEQKQKKKEKES